MGGVGPDRRECFRPNVPAERGGKVKRGEEGPNARHFLKVGPFIFGGKGLGKRLFDATLKRRKGEDN